MTRSTKRAGFIFLIFLSSSFLHQPHIHGYEKVYTTPETVCLTDFPTHTSLKSNTITLTGNIKEFIESDLGITIRNSNATLYTLYKNEEILGYSVQLDELGKHEPITLMTSISPKFKVINVTILIYREKIGDSVRKNRFTNQFKKKTLTDPLMINRDLDGITGATVSSWSVATAVRKSLLIVKGLSSENSL